MTTINKTDKGLEYLVENLKVKPQTITRVLFWKIPHDTPKEDICLKIGRYKKDGKSPEVDQPKSELTLDNEEFQALIKFLSENFEPFKKGIKKYIPLNEDFDDKKLEHLRAFFDNPDKQQIIDFVVKNNIFPDDLVAGLQHQVRIGAIKKFEQMLKENQLEQKWQEWFEENNWVLGTEFVKILDEREIDTQNITDYLMQAYDGFLDIVEIKRPEGTLKFWSEGQDHGNYIPTSDLTKAITQAT